MIYREARQDFSLKLKNAGIEEAETEIWMIMESVLQIDRNYYLLHQTEEISEENIRKLSDLVSQREKRIPLQYLLGETEFMGLPFYVNSNVLIPRPDTETLVETAMRYITKPMSVLDMCTGSGAVAVSLAHYTNVEVTAADLSGNALSVAKKNCERNQTKINLIESDLFANIEGSYDMIVSNPPYIRSEEILFLMPEVKDHEPILALDGREDGLYFYKKIATLGYRYLKNNGFLIFEIGFDQGKEVSDCMRKAGYIEVEVIQDLAGLDRVVKGKKSNV